MKIYVVNCKSVIPPLAYFFDREEAYKHIEVLKEYDSVCGLYPYYKVYVVNEVEIQGTPVTSDQSIVKAFSELMQFATYIRDVPYAHPNNRTRQAALTIQKVKDILGTTKVV